MVAIRIYSLCVAAAAVAPILHALPASIGGGRIVLCQCVDDQSRVTTSWHAIPACDGRLYKFEALEMRWVEVIRPGRIVEG